MANRRLFREPDENSGPAIMGREPVVLPDERKMVAERVKQAVGNGGNRGDASDDEGRTIKR